jgi:hypothetical protein
MTAMICRMRRPENLMKKVLKFKEELTIFTAELIAGWSSW